MKAAGWIGIGAVALVAGGLAGLLVWGLPGAAPPALDVGDDAGVAFEPVDATTPAAKRRSGTAPASEDSTGAARGPIPLFTTDGLSPELLGLHPDFETAMARAVTMDDLPQGASAQDLDKAISVEMMGLVSEVQGAAEAHLTYAETAPREQATLARERAAQLYQHLSEAILEVPMPPDLPAAQAEVQRLTRQRMAEGHARRAALLRAQGN